MIIEAVSQDKVPPLSVTIHLMLPRNAIVHILHGMTCTVDQLLP